MESSWSRVGPIQYQVSWREAQVGKREAKEHVKNRPHAKLREAKTKGTKAFPDLGANIWTPS